MEKVAAENTSREFLGASKGFDYAKAQMLRFREFLKRELPKAVLPAFFSFLLAFLGARLAFQTTIKSRSYDRKIEAIGNLRTSSVKWAALATAQFSANTQAKYFRRRVLRFEIKDERDDLRYWDRRANEMSVQLAAAKGDFHGAVEIVRLLFPNNEKIQTLIQDVNNAVAMEAPDPFESAESLEEVNRRHPAAMASISGRVDAGIGGPFDKLISSLEVEVGAP